MCISLNSYDQKTDSSQNAVLKKNKQVSTDLMGIISQEFGK